MTSPLSLHRGTTRIAALCVLWSLAAQGFQVQFRSTPTRVLTQQLWLSSKTPHFVDVEFERTPDPEEEFSKKKKKKSNKKKATKSKGFAKDKSGKSLFDLSLEANPQWKDARIPFVDPARETAIDGTLAFCVELDGIEYGIATPCDAAAAITVEDKLGRVTNFYPDDNDNEEIMEIMATQLVEHVGEDLSLKRTPRVLTIEGDLERYMENWQDEILPTPTESKELLGVGETELDEDLKFFHEFMKKELGEEEYQKTLNEPVTSEDFGDELMALFDVPGFGALKDDLEGMQKLFDDLEKEEDPSELLRNTLEDPLDHEGAALKLISYNFKDGTAYSLVKLLKPYTLVGRLVKEEESIHFDLLTPEEEKLVIPKLEEVCRTELKKAGLELSP